MTLSMMMKMIKLIMNKTQKVKMTFLPMIKTKDDLRVPQLGLPSMVQDYLLYDLDVDDIKFVDISTGDDEDD